MRADVEAQSQGWVTLMHITVKSQVSGPEWPLGVCMAQAKGWGFGSMAVWGNSSGGGGELEEKRWPYVDCEGLARDVGEREMRETGSSLHD